MTIKKLEKLVEELREIAIKTREYSTDKDGDNTYSLHNSIHNAYENLNQAKHEMIRLGLNKI